MGTVRPFVARDLPEVAALHRRVILHLAEPVPAGLRVAHETYFREAFVEQPSPDPRLPSLVYADGDGRLQGFLGVLPRRIRVDGRSLAAAVSAQFVVDPGSRTALAGIQLLKAFLSGPQDLSITDGAIESGRRMLEALGAVTSPLHSLYWLRVLAPSRLFLAGIRTRRPGSRLAGLPIRALGPMADALVGRLWGDGARPHPVDVDGDHLELAEWAAAAAELPDPSDTRAEYDEPTLEWLYRLAEAVREKGQLARVGVRDRGGRLLGWYVYYRNPGGVSEVLQLGARPGALRDVMGHLMYRASREGAAAVAGRLEPRLVDVLGDRFSVILRRGTSVVLHARQPALLQRVRDGAGFLSRLDGELPFCFWPASRGAGPC